MNTKALYSITSGLYMLSSKAGDKTGGCIVNTVMQVTSTPLRITVTVNKQNNTHDLIMESGIFAVSMLDKTAPFGLIQHFGFQSGRDTDKFAGLLVKTDENGVPYLTWSSCGFLSCKVVSSMDLGTHTQFLADVLDCEVLSDNEGLSYAYYQSDVKPKPEKKAKGWRCTICGYVHEDEELPEDFICPLCKHGAADFEPIK